MKENKISVCMGCDVNRIENAFMFLQMDITLFISKFALEINVISLTFCFSLPIKKLDQLFRGFPFLNDLKLVNWFFGCKK